jgi:hypothetical protein
MLFILVGKNYQFHLWLIIIKLKLGLVFKTWIQTRILLLKIWIQNQVPIFIYVWNWNWYTCHDLNLGFVTKARARKGTNWEWNLGVTYTLLGLWENVKEWAHTLQVDFHFGSWSLNGLLNLHKTIEGSKFIRLITSLYYWKYFKT